MRLALAFAWMCWGSSLSLGSEVWRDLLMKSLEEVDAGHYNEALVAADAALEEARKFGAGNLREAFALTQSGNAHGFLGQFEEAERDLRRGALILSDYPKERLALCQIWINLGNLFASSGGRVAQAETMRQRALDLARVELGPGHPLVGELMGNLAETKIVRRKWGEARELLEGARNLVDGQAAAQREAASVHASLGLLALFEQMPEVALAESQKSLELLRGVFAAGHPDFIVPLLNLGRAQLLLRQTREAGETIREAQAIVELRLGTQHPHMAEVLLARAAVLRESGRKREASQMERRAQEIRRMHTGSGSAGGEVSVGELMAENAGRHRK
jgi:tetratricopeptide (TPR) repeat protein